MELDFYAGHAFAVHFHDGKPRIAEIETFAAFGNKAELIEHETADSSVSRIFRNGDVVLRFEVANIEGGVENHRAVGERERALHDIEFVVNFANHLFEDIFEGDETEDAAELVNHYGQSDVVRAQLKKEFARGLGFRNDQHLTQHAAQSKRWRGLAFFESAFAIEKRPQHIFDVHEAENVILRATVHGNARALRGGKGAHHFVERGLDGKRVHVRARNHDFANLDLANFDSAENKLFFAGR